MTVEAWITVVVIGGVIFGLMRSVGPSDVLLMGATILLALCGIISPEEAFSGFVNKGVLTIAALYIIAAALRETGALDTIGRWVLGRARSESAALTRIALPLTVMSAFMNNTPVVAMMVPVINAWCRKSGVSPSRMLIPLSYMTILGGMCTLIGTSTNLVVNGLMQEYREAATEPALKESLRTIDLFELSALGAPLAVLGLIYILLIGRHLLPRRLNVVAQMEQGYREYVVELKVMPDCRLVGQAIEEAGLRKLPGLFLSEILRGDEVISPVPPDQEIHQGDILAFAGAVSTIVDLERIPGLVPAADENYEVRTVPRRYQQLCEAVISATSPIVGRSIRDAQFRASYNAAVVAVHRGGERVQGRIGDVVLRNGDTLLIQAGTHFVEANWNNPDFYLVSSISEARPVRHERSVLSMVLLLVLVIWLAWNPRETHLAAFAVAGLLIGTRCISAATARTAVDLQTLITISASFGLGLSLKNSGASVVIGDWIQAVDGNFFGSWGLLLVLYALTNALTEMITTKAAVALMFPVVLAIAASTGIDPRALIMTITFAAACSFVTPLGYQTNLMVFGPGGYRYLDYARIGLPLTFMFMIVATLLIPVIWPLYAAVQP